MIKKNWFIIFLYTLTVLVDWAFAYLVQSQPEIIVNSWSVIFPLMTFFYGAFSTLAFIGMIQRARWGFSLSYITLVGGAILASISYLHAFRLYSIVQPLFIALLIFNFVTILCILIFCQRQRIFPN